MRHYHGRMSSTTPPTIPDASSNEGRIRCEVQGPLLLIGIDRAA